MFNRIFCRGANRQSDRAISFGLAALTLLTFIAAGAPVSAAAEPGIPTMSSRSWPGALPNGWVMAEVSAVRLSSPKNHSIVP